MKDEATGREPDAPADSMKLALFGTGRMGREVEAVARERGHRITLRLAGSDNAEGRGITRESLAGARMAVDFTAPDAVLANVRAAAAAGASIVVGTTGWESDREAVEEAVREGGTGLLHAPNFSLGMLLFLRLVEEAARLADQADRVADHARGPGERSHEPGEGRPGLAGPASGYDVHLWEAHHRYKRDHPGGTARRLAELLVERLARKRRWATSLPDGRPVDPEVLQVAVIRAGEVPGTHAIALDGPDDRIELRHEARGRRGFARGAVLAAEWLRGRRGIYTLDDLLDSSLPEREGSP